MNCTTEPGEAEPLDPKSAREASGRVIESFAQSFVDVQPPLYFELIPTHEFSHGDHDYDHSFSQHSVHKVLTCSEGQKLTTNCVPKNAIMSQSEQAVVRTIHVTHLEQCLDRRVHNHSRHREPCVPSKGGREVFIVATGFEKASVPTVSAGLTSEETVHKLHTTFCGTVRGRATASSLTWRREGDGVPSNTSASPKTGRDAGHKVRLSGVPALALQPARIDKPQQQSPPTMKTAHSFLDRLVVQTSVKPHHEMAKLVCDSSCVIALSLGNCPDLLTSPDVPPALDGGACGRNYLTPRGQPANDTPRGLEC